MFGLEDQKKKKAADFVFELETDFKNSRRRAEIKKHVETKVQKIKDVLRGGENKDEFDKFGLLLHGYTSLLKVMARSAPK